MMTTMMANTDDSCALKMVVDFDDYFSGRDDHDDSDEN